MTSASDIAPIVIGSILIALAAAFFSFFYRGKLTGYQTRSRLCRHLPRELLDPRQGPRHYPRPTRPPKLAGLSLICSPGWLLPASPQRKRARSPAATVKKHNLPTTLSLQWNFLH